MNLKTALILLTLVLTITWSAGASLSTPHDSTLSVGSATHPVSVVEADIYVNRKRTTMRLTCFAEDLELLQGIEAMQDGLYDSEELIDATKDHAQYLAEKITIRDAAGELMTPKIMEIINIEIPEEGIKAGNLMNFTMGFVIEYRYDEPPEFVTVQQKMVADGALLPSELKILLKQAGSDTPYMHMMKPSTPETFRFDWDNPILSTDASDEEWETWFETQREKNLGITSYSSVYSFVYINNHEVRHEVLIPLATLASFIDFERADESFLDIPEQVTAAEKIKAYFSVGNPVTIDSVEVQPVFDRIDFYGLDLRDFAVQAEKRKISMASGRVGIIMSYSTKGSPTSVELTWDKFNTVIRSIDSVVFAYDKVETTEFSMFLPNNTFQWSEPDRKPLPLITGVSSKLDLNSLKPKTIELPMFSIGLVVCGFLAFLSRLAGVPTKPAVATAFVCWIASVFTTGLMPREFKQPFAEAPVFEMDDQEAEQIFTLLHKNMFRAFDYHRENDVYDALAKSVDGELLRELYLKINKSLTVKEQGGAVSKVNQVTLLDGLKTDEFIGPEGESPGFGYRCKWKLIGTIEHWGHIHERENEFDAKFEIRLKDDAWKITLMQVVDESPPVIKQSLRKLPSSESKPAPVEMEPTPKQDSVAEKS
ncbi:MAG: hypothetical protein ACI87E_001521 [Mariniblastus sp.]|jgi:hypothetical protein